MSLLHIMQDAQSNNEPSCLLWLVIALPGKDLVFKNQILLKCSQVGARTKEHDVER